MANIYGKDTLNDWLVGSSGNDNIKGFGGDDSLKGGGGADYLEGGPGNDTVLYTDSSHNVFVDLYHGVGQGGTAQGDTYSSIENVAGSAYSDVIHGHNGPNTLTGLDGDDHLFGQGGADVLDGGSGHDHFTGGPGADTFYGGSGIDTVSYYGAPSGVSVTLGSYGYGGEAHGDVIYGVENLEGTHYNDTLSGNGDANSLSAYSGNDVIYGFGGNDNIYGGLGNDTIHGHDGADWMEGGDGLDRLYPGLDRDVLTGGGNGDYFFWATPSEMGLTVETFDVIRDFNRLDGDMINLSGVDGDETTPGSQGFTFIGRDGFTGPGQIRYEDWRGNTYVYVNTDADLSFEAGLRLEGLHTVRPFWFQ
jgi:Ca2+-binding RTX toxin-like protein